MDVSEEEFTPLMNPDLEGSLGSSFSADTSLEVHLYFLPSTKAASTTHISCSQISAEDVCIHAAKKCGILPVYRSLFGLASQNGSFWFPPSHLFRSEEHVQVLFRVRFFFANWFEQGPRASYRYGLTRDRVSPVLNYSVIEYLFAQLRHDFISSEAGVAPPLSSQEECLGLAVLDLWRMARERHQSVREICRTVSYKSCLPESHREDIQRRNRLNRFRIRSTLKHFLKKLVNCSVDECSLKVKYLLELAAVVPALGSETFRVNASSSSCSPTFTLLRVSGETGIQTGGGSLHGAMEWQTFCDFKEIIDITVMRVAHEQVSQEDRMVTITRNDDKCLGATFKGLQEAHSFVSLVDGYFRLTTDSTHYFCQDITPPSILSGLRDRSHGPITSEFAVNKLKKLGCDEGTFLLRQSPKTYDNFYLTVCVQTPLGLDYKNCLIIKNEKYSLPGVSTLFSTLKELTRHLQHNKMLVAEIPFKLGRCCPPRPKELTNLIIVRNSSTMDTQGSHTPERNKFDDIQFHMIKFEDLTWGESLGQGSFTRIFRGYKAEVRDGEKKTTEVLLKELDVDHKNCWESFFEAASVMTQISHKHLLLVYGVSMKGATNVMVQEFVKHGALDLYLKRGRSVSVSWKLEITKQLASALNFLEEKNIVHGNICAKNLLLAREGDQTQGSSPFIKLSDPGISVTVLGREVVLDRIPWVAPEVLDAPDDLSLECDKWSFGATVWEIFNGGIAPLHGCDLQMKQQFYETLQQLPRSQWTELADLIDQCMNYQPDFRPSCRGIIRHLNSLITSDYVILHATEPVSDSAVTRTTSLHSHTLFEERHLRYISLLGKGNFGCVELCRYDPLGDDTGELVAVKKLQADQQSTMQDFQKEVDTLSRLRCDYIVKYRGVCYSAGRLNMSLVMEYLPHGNLIGYMDKNKNRINTQRMLLFALQICKGMEHLQTLRYVHRDLAGRNILVASDALVKIADFGLTKIIPFEKEYYRVTQPGKSPIFWFAPESIKESRFSQMSDVWSFGVVLHELFSRCDANCSPKRLFMQEIGHNIQGPSVSMHVANILKDQWRLPAPLDCPAKVYAVMKQCWAFNFEERPGFSNLTEQIENIMQERLKSN